MLSSNRAVLFYSEQNLVEGIYNINDSRINNFRNNIICSMVKSQYETWKSYVDWDEQRWIEIIESRCDSTNLNSNTFVYLKPNDNDVQYIGSVSLKKGCSDVKNETNFWISGLYVIPEYRKKKISHRLFAQALNEAKKLNIETVFLFTMIEKLDQIYESIGFEEKNKTSVDGNSVIIRAGQVEQVLYNMENKNKIPRP